MSGMLLAAGMRVRRRVLGAVGGSAIVLTYHRIAELKRDPQRLALSPELFNDQIRALSSAFRMVPLTEIVDALAEQRPLPRRSVAVTFDDGYADNLVNAKPILESAGVPGTVFVATARLHQPSEFWWDELEQLILGTETLPERLSIPGKDHIACPGCPQRTDMDDARFSGWSVLEEPPTPRHSLYLHLSRLIERESPASRIVILRSIREQLGAVGGPRVENRHLTRDELKALTRGDLIDVGAHTVSHSRLSELPVSQQESEIAESKQDLESSLSRPIRLFSYPYGDPASFTEDTVRIVRRLGFSGAVGTHHTMVTKWTDRYRVPRYAATATSGDELVRSVCRWFGD